MSKESLEKVRPWIIPLIVPILTLIVGYLTLFVKSNVLAEVNKLYVPQTTYSASEEKIKNLAQEIAPLTIKINQIDTAQQKTDLQFQNLMENFKFIREDLKEIKTDLKELRQNP